MSKKVVYIGVGGSLKICRSFFCFKSSAKEFVMASLGKCPTCGGVVSRSAMSCPHCGEIGFKGEIKGEKKILCFSCGGNGLSSCISNDGSRSACYRCEGTREIEVEIDYDKRIGIDREEVKAKFEEIYREDRLRRQLLAERIAQENLRAQGNGLVGLVVFVVIIGLLIYVFTCG